jgi:hypothetical protein|mmetsp:Transcript_49938/g.82286  ORF Transcript_49938/g.82286 Transcript_49938/m.82286 type:complete len:141 (-) Transcript_49938:1931-2353(-)
MTVHMSSCDGGMHEKPPSCPETEQAEAAGWGAGQTDCYCAPPPQGRDLWGLTGGDARVVSALECGSEYLGVQNICGAGAGPAIFDGDKEKLSFMKAPLFVACCRQDQTSTKTPEWLPTANERYFYSQSSKVQTSSPCCIR